MQSTGPRADMQALQGATHATAAVHRLNHVDGLPLRHATSRSTRPRRSARPCNIYRAHVFTLRCT